MSAIVTVFRSEFKNKPVAHVELVKLSNEINEIGDAHAYAIRSGRLFEFLSILQKNQIVYRTHFDILDNSEKTSAVGENLDHPDS